MLHNEQPQFAPVVGQEKEQLSLHIFERGHSGLSSKDLNLSHRLSDGAIRMVITLITAAQEVQRRGALRLPSQDPEKRNKQQK